MMGGGTTHHDGVDVGDLVHQHVQHRVLVLVVLLPAYVRGDEHG